MRIKLFILTLLFPFFGAGSALAVTITISNVPATISDRPFSLDVAISGASPATNYLRVNLFPTGTTNYFGYTYNGSIFVNSSTYSQYLPITIDTSGRWSGTIQAQLDAKSSYYHGPGTYSLKVRRYTESGSSYTWSDEITTNVVFQTPSPSPTPAPASTSAPSPVFLNTPIPSPLPSQSPQDDSPSLSPTPSILPSPPSTKLASVQPTASPNQLNSYQRLLQRLAATHTASVAGTSSATSGAPALPKTQTNPIVWIGSAFIFVGASLMGYIILRKR